MTNQIFVRLKIKSTSRTPEMITKVLGLGCDRSWQVGDKRGHTIIKETNNGWILNSGLAKTDLLDEHVQQLLKRLEPYRDKIRLLAREDIVEFSCVIYADSVPALYFESDVIDRLAQLGAKLDIDLYLGQQVDGP